VREGTVICMLGVGLIMKPIMKLLKKPLHTLLYGKETQALERVTDKQ
jgi:uncharacterized membrane protein YczE